MDFWCEAACYPQASMSVSSDRYPHLISQIDVSFFANILLEWPGSVLDNHCYPYTSAMPEVRGTADVGWRAYSPFRSILLVLTHDFIIICVYGPTGSDGQEWMVPTRTLVAHHFWPFEAKGVLYAWGPI